MAKCVFMEDMLKSQCKFVTLLEKYTQQKQVGWEVIFSELGFAGSGARKPRRELEGSSLDFFAACSEASGGFNCVSKVLLKSQCKKYGIWKGKIKPHHGKVCISLPTLFYKNHRNIMLWWKSWYTSLVKNYTLWEKKTHHAVIKRAAMWF